MRHAAPCSSHVISRAPHLDRMDALVEQHELAPLLLRVHALRLGDDVVVVGLQREVSHVLPRVRDRGDVGGVLVPVGEGGAGGK